MVRYCPFFSSRAMRRFMNVNNDSDVFLFLAIMIVYYDVYKNIIGTPLSLFEKQKMPL